MPARRAPAMMGLIAAVLVLAPSSLIAQRRASEHGTVSQKVDGTTISIEYDRPVARGRDLFGKLVRWNQTWTPGANNATTIEVDKDVRINGGVLPKGKYSVWMIPRESEAWTVFFHRNAKLFHVQRPSQAEEQLHIDVTPEQGAHMETLAWYFPVVGPETTMLRMHWGTTIVAMTIDVSSTAVFDSLTAAQRARYVGTYRMSGEWGGDAEVVIRDVDGTLLGSRQPPLPNGHDFALIPAGGAHRFHMGQGDKGRVLEVSSIDETVVFLFAGDSVTAFEVRTKDGKVVWRGDLVKK